VVRTLIGLLLSASITFAPPDAHAQSAPLGAPWDSVGRVLGANGAANAGTVRYNIPRVDLRLRVGDVAVAPALALITWAAFGVMGTDTVVMGDVVTVWAELGTVLHEFADNGIEVMAVHNHLAGEVPRLTYVHYMGRGSAVALAAKVRNVIARTGAPMPVAARPPAPATIDTALLFGELGVSGRVNGDVAQLSFNFVPGGVILGGQPVPAPLAYASPINVQRVTARRVVATGDFTVPGAKVNGVLAALARAGITATAMHSHMVNEEPTLYYIHFWADGTLRDVARGLRLVVDAAR